MSILQYEFNAIVGRGEELRQASGRNSGGSQRPRLVVLPKYLSFILGIGGGAFAFAGMIFVNEKLASAPVAVRRFVLAHEAAHALFGHCSRLLGYWAVIFGSAVIARGLIMGDHGRLAECLILGAGIALAEVAKPFRWELEADHLAATVIGADIGRGTLEGVFKYYNVRLGSVEKKRLKALELEV
jgi:Zn-dependent protease with chaperone function